MRRPTSSTTRPCGWTRRGLLALAAAAWWQGAAAASDPPRPATPVAAEITPGQNAAVTQGLSWLSDQQAPDGSFGNLSHYGPHVGITGLVGLAFMSCWFIAQTPVT